MHRLATTTLVLCAVFATVAACGDDADSGSGSDLSREEQAYVDEALEGFDAEEEAPLTEDDARCIATSMVEEVGVDRLEEIGLTPESFSSDEDLPEGLEAEDAENVVDGISSCIDMRALFLEGFADDESISAEAKECLAEQFDEALVRRTMVVMLSEGEDALTQESGIGAELTAAVMACPGAIG